MPETGPEDILGTYQRVGPQWAAGRSRSLFERAWLERFLRAASGPRVLDLGCGSGQPIAAWLFEQGCEVTGVDGAASMCALFAENLPDAAIHQADMRYLSLDRRFDAILAWNSFFHLSGADQRAMFAVFEAHAAPGASLMFTSGPHAGEAIGLVAGAPVYHASLAAEDYRSLLARHGFDVLKHIAEDPDCAGHTVWLARRTGVTDV